MLYIQNEKCIYKYVCIDIDIYVYVSPYFCHIFGITIENEKNIDKIFIFQYFHAPLASHSSAFDFCPMISHRWHNRRVPNRNHMAVTIRIHYGDHNRRYMVLSNSHRKTDVDSRRYMVFDYRNNSMLARNHSVCTCAAYPRNYYYLTIMNNTKITEKFRITLTDQIWIKDQWNSNKYFSLTWDDISENIIRKII